MSEKRPGQGDMQGRLSRRSFLERGAMAAAAPALVKLTPFGASAAQASARDLAKGEVTAAITDIVEASIADLQAAMSSGAMTSRSIVEAYLARIEALDKNGPMLNAVLELNPEALAIADALDQERQSQGPRGPLHGIPILIKDNIDTADQMHTTAGSLALLDARPLQDSTLAAKLRQAGMVILGKTGLSEWANFRSTHASSGWSGRGKQVLNAYAQDRSPSGSSSGSAVATAASLTAIAIGTETNGSIVSPSSYNSLVGIKPSVGLVSRAGIIPISHNQDTAGPIARSVTDAATLLGALTGIDQRDAATQDSGGKSFTDYTQFLDANGLQGARIGVARKVYFGYSEKTDAVANAAVDALKQLGAVVIDPADLPSAADFASAPTTEVLLWDFKADVNAYLAGLGPDSPMKTLQDLIDFNNSHADQEMPYFGQELFLRAQAKTDLTDPAYQTALTAIQTLARANGIDAVMDQYNLDAIVAPTNAPPFKIDLIDGDHSLGSSSSPAAIAGYPNITVPAGYTFGLPIGLSFFGRRWSEPMLIKLAYAFEQGTHARVAPAYGK
jgi:amidase